MQEITCDGVPISKLPTAEIEEFLKHPEWIEFNIMEGTFEEAKAATIKRLELEIRIRNMGLR